MGGSRFSSRGCRDRSRIEVAIDDDLARMLMINNNEFVCIPTT